VLWCCIHFPRFELQVFPRLDRADTPAVCTDPSRQGIVLACNRTALDRGIRPGMSASAAHGLCPGLDVVWRDPAREASRIEGIGLWAMRFTPTVSVAPPSAVLLEVEGCLAYFGGARALLSQIRSAAAELGLESIVASAPTASAALVFAQTGQAVDAADPATLAALLDPLPVSRIEAPADSIQALLGMGIDTLGACRALPRAGFARRLGQAWLDLLDRCYGDLREARPTLSLPTRFHRRIELPAPTDDVEALLFAANRLVQECCGWLQGHGAGATRLALALHHDRAPVTRVAAGMQPTREAAHLLLVLREHLSRCALPAPVDELELEVAERVTLVPRNLELRIDSGGEVRQSIDRLLDRLRARLGEASVTGLATRADHRPEVAWAARDPGQFEASVSTEGAARPLWLLTEPVALASAIGESVERIVQGPERIESGWWDGGDVTRDYYVVLTPQGMRWWIFHHREQKRWFLQGLFG
jgi:protein ImuB